MFVVDYQQATKHVEAELVGGVNGGRCFRLELPYQASDAAPEVTPIEYLNIVIYL